MSETEKEKYIDKLLEKIKRIRRKTVVVLGAGDLYDKFKEKIKNG